MRTVSIIIPCYNESLTILLLLEAIYAQTYPRSSLEVIIADGLSTDCTRQVIQSYLDDHSEFNVRIVDNPLRNIPSALNTALSHSSGDIIIRLDAHCVPQADYVQRCVQDLERGLGTTVGGVWDIRPGGKSWIARAIAVAASHPLGVGDARYRYSSKAGSVDTVPFGAYHRSLLDQIGRYDPTLLTNEDYEFNTRVRKNGGTVWLDPSIRSIYYARSGFADLAKQYWRYGFWKFRMLQRYPATLRWRQALPPLFLTSLVGLGIAAPFFSAARILLSVDVGIYLAGLVISGILAAYTQRDWTLLIGLPPGIALMHFSWGAGFLWSFLRHDT
ncbi:MAG TPA: glycosyltransferase family 2 protein [Anaerolineaceae bacterium]|nr:glycosyltransferase family 2 protein [Anaerolineaceae bacterium]